MQPSVATATPQPEGESTQLLHRIYVMTFAPRSRFEWQLCTRSLPLGDRTYVMGIVNATPDSFSDGGLHYDSRQAIDHALRLLDEGADILDIGGESTQPGSPAATTAAIAASEEQQRVLPVMEGILHARPDAVISVDTYRSSTAQLAIEAGAQIVNDVSGGMWDEAMLATCAGLCCGLVLMHTRGLPTQWTSQQPLQQQEVLPLVLRGLQERLETAAAAGIQRNRIVIDPGFGFGKRRQENWTLLAGLHQLSLLKMPLLIGLSRKGFLAPHLPASERDPQTHAADVAALLAGAHILRVHDVRGTRESAAIADAILDAL